MFLCKQLWISFGIIVINATLSAHLGGFQSEHQRGIRARPVEGELCHPWLTMRSHSGKGKLHPQHWEHLSVWAGDCGCGGEALLITSQSSRDTVMQMNLRLAWNVNSTVGSSFVLKNLKTINQWKPAVVQDVCFFKKYSWLCFKTLIASPSHHKKTWRLEDSLISAIRRILR